MLNTMKTILNTDRRIFLITFQHRTTNKKFMFQDAKELVYILKTYDGTGVESIKEFNPIKNTFGRVSKADILSFANWETEAIIYLKKHYFFT